MPESDAFGLLVRPAMGKQKRLERQFRRMA
jgi:hypothetical protein